MKKFFGQKLALAAWVFVPMITLFFIYTAYLYNSAQKPDDDNMEMNVVKKIHERSIVSSFETMEKEILN